MSWEDQGRQHRGWFGHGTAADQGARSASFLPGSLEDRVHAVAYGAIAALPASVRGRVEEQYQHGTLSDLHEAMTAWIKEAHLDQATFAERFLGRAADDPVALSLRSSVNAAATATSHDDIKDAAIHLADAIKGVGVDQWPRFVANAAKQNRAAGDRYGMSVRANAQDRGRQAGPDRALLHKVQLAVPLPPPPPGAGLRTEDASRAAARYLTQGWKAVTEAARNGIGNIVSAEPTSPMRLGGTLATETDGIISNSQPSDDKSATTPTGRKDHPIAVKPGTNPPTEIDGRIYTGHGLDRMQGRGVTPSAVEDAIENGESSPGNTPGTTVHTGKNGVIVVIGSNGQVITVIRR